MEDFKFSDSSNVGPISSVDFSVSTSSQQSFFNTPSSVSDLVSNYQTALTMQDDPLNENSSHSNTQNSCQQSTENGNDDQVNVSQTKDDGISMVNLGNGVQTDSPEQRDVSGIANNQLPAYSASEPSLNVINSISSSNLWASNVDDNILHNFNVSSTNGGLTFQNFSPSENTLYEPNLGNHISGLTSSQIQSQQRRTVNSQNYPHNIQRNLSQTNPQQNVYLANKMYNHSWNQSQTWNRGRSTPNLNPMQNLSNRKPNPSFSQQQQTMLMNQKYRRSTSFPGKNVFSQGNAYDINHVDDSSDLILPYQAQCPQPPLGIAQKELKGTHQVPWYFFRLPLQCCVM
ncbi:hypothetical protein V9T40_010314 [Parthenolecanium corni]|uniref:Uncharacterized protein n=1 Tax=Parthenolecanium corni TaxID=536013 RepID=A0AAN9Y024_9HEMI